MHSATDPRPCLRPDSPRSTLRVRLLAIAAVLALLPTGCKGVDPHKGHKQNVNKANQRWLELRSGLMLQMAQQQFDTGDLEQSELTLADAINLDAKNGHLHVLAGRIALERNQLERAYGRFERAIELAPRLPDAQFFQAVVLQRWQRLEQALERYKLAYELQADNPSYLLAIAEALVAMDRHDEAIELLAGKVTYFDQNASIRAALGQLHGIRKEYAKAAEYLRAAQLLRPDDLQMAEQLATAQLAAGQFKEGIAGLERLCGEKKLAERRDLRVALAGAYRLAGRDADARAAYLRLTRSDPSDLDSWTALAETAWAEGDVNGTLLAAHRMMSIAPREPEGHIYAGLAWQKRDRLDEALKYFDRAAALAPQDPNPVILRGLALQKADRMAAAAESYHEALRRKPDDERARQLLASVTTADDRTP